MSNQVANQSFEVTSIKFTNDEKSKMLSFFQNKALNESKYWEAYDAIWIKSFKNVKPVHFQIRTKPKFFFTLQANFDEGITQYSNTVFKEAKLNEQTSESPSSIPDYSLMFGIGALLEFILIIILLVIK